MATYSKISLQPTAGTSNLGVAIKVAATTSGSSGTTIHTTGTSAANFDEVWLYAYNSDTVSRILTIQWGGVTAPDNEIKTTLPANSGLILIVPGLVITGTGSASSVVSAYASATNVITVSGYVNRVA